MPADPFVEIRSLGLWTLRGANYWSRRPVTRLDLAPGAFDEISSADVGGFADALVDALPGLVEHRCSPGRRGGFVERLRTGTYAPHIIEHVGLELQGAAGHGVGYGRSRGGDRPGQYTVILEHWHAAVGRASARHALEIVQHAFARLPIRPEAAIAELRQLALRPDDAATVRDRAFCGVTGGAARREVCAALAAAFPEAGAVVDVPPATLLTAGLGYARSRVAVILDASPDDVPARFREPRRARKLLSVLADGVEDGGVVFVPASDPALYAAVRGDARRVARLRSTAPAAVAERVASLARFWQQSVAS